MDEKLRITRHVTAAILASFVAATVTLMPVSLLAKTDRDDDGPALTMNKVFEKDGEVYELYIMVVLI
jgi:hypothetical protein